VRRGNKASLVTIVCSMLASFLDRTSISEDEVQQWWSTREEERGTP